MSIANSLLSRTLIAVVVALCLLLGTTDEAGASGQYLRVRFSEPAPGLRFAPVSGLSAWSQDQASLLTADLGVPVVPTISASAALSLHTRLSIRRLARGSASASATLAELQRWGRVFVPDDQAPHVMAMLVSDPRVDRIEAVAISELCALSPDDPYLPNQQVWLDLVGLPEAWQMAELPGENRARVAIVDAGTDWLHPDLLANVAINEAEIAADGIDQDGNGYVDDVYGWNFVTDNGDPSPVPGLLFSGRHGTHVAGTVGAVLGNGVGVAGAGGNPELILVNAAHPAVDGAIAFGYEGILYALTRDVDIINCSWRTARVVNGQLSDAPWREFEVLVLALAREAGALVIGATGNDFQADLWTTPAGYEDCLAVGATNNSEVVPWQASNLGGWVELMAPGQFMISTLPRGTEGHLGPYGLLSGTSMAAALTSGIAALALGQHPDWDADELRSRLRWTSQPHTGLADKRLIRADLALAQAAGPDLELRIEGLADADADGLAEGGEIVDLRFTVQAVFERQVAVLVQASTDDPWLTPLISSVSIPAVGADEPLPLSRGLKFWVHPSTPAGHVAQIQLRAVVDGVQGPLQNGMVTLRPMAAQIAGEEIGVVAATNGMLGEATQVVSRRKSRPALARSSDGAAFLHRAALLVGNAEDRVSDALMPRSPLAPVKDFSPLQDGLARIEHADGSREIRLLYSDRGSSRGLGLTVQQRVLLHGRSDLDDFVFVEYAFTAGEQALMDLRWGLALDWEMPSGGAGEAHLDERFVSIAGGAGIRVESSVEGAGAGVAGLIFLGEAHEVGLGSMLEWASEDEAGWKIPSDFQATASDPVLWAAMQPGEHQSLERTGSRVAVVSARLGDLERGQTRTVTVALSIARDAGELEARLQAARVAFEAGLEGLDPAALEDSIVRFSHNPFSSATELSFALAAAGRVRVDVYDLRGRHVRSLLDASRRAGVHRLGWNGQDDQGASVASGVYFVRLQTASRTESRAVTRVR